MPLPESALLLRLKALAGDREPEVTGQCLASLLDVAPGASVAFVARFLARAEPEIRAEAAAALAACREPEAFEALCRYWPREEDPVVRRAVLGFLGAATLPRAAELLLEIVATCPGAAGDALAALASSRFREPFRERAGAIVPARGDARLERVFEETFGRARVDGR